MENNIIKTFTQDDLKDFHWMINPISYRVADGALYVTPEGQSDLFFSPLEPRDRFNAAVLTKKVKGNFIAVINTEPDFDGRANAAGLFGYLDKDHWAKLCFERTGPGAIGACALCTTKYRSDDSNAETLRDNPKSLWMKYCRFEDAFSMFYSLDGENYTFIRKYALPGFSDEMEVGIFAQCPDCGPKEHKINFLSIKPVDKVNIRTGIEE
ncbi:MAG: DUF1349 domain-containing protein [Clostridiales bacterium]|nr:DUF1349 domain-containing protein [Clostridiales bacterium]